MVAKISASIVDAVLTEPNMDTLSFEPLPSVQLHLKDLKIDLATFVTKVEDTKLSSQDGSWGTESVPGTMGEVKRLIAFDAKPGVSASVAFDSAFKPALNRMNADYSMALSNFRDEYKTDCNGDPCEVRSLTDS